MTKGKGGARVSTGADSVQNYATPWKLLRAVERKLDMKVGFDLAADDTNSKAPAGMYYDEHRNALTRDWYHTQRSIGMDKLLWLNPPFSNIRPWAEKCYRESQRGANIALLVPASVGSDWFDDFAASRYVLGDAYVRALALKGRIPFMVDQPKWGYPKDCALIVYGAQAARLLPRGFFSVWDWRVEPCHACGGRGAFIGGEPCTSCTAFEENRAAEDRASEIEAADRRARRVACG